MQQHQRQAISAYNDTLDATIAETKANLKRLEQCKNASTMHIHWGHVQEISDMHTTVKNLGDKLYQRGEYAPAMI